MLRPHLQRMGKVPTAIHPFEKREPMATLIQDKKEEFWFHRVVSIGYRNWLNPYLFILIAMVRSVPFWRELLGRQFRHKP